jgi:hypothetical protein
VEGLDASDRAEWEDVLWAFIEDPFPADQSSVLLGPPFQPGVWGHASVNFWFTFTMVNSEVVWIPTIQFRPGSPKDPNHGLGLLL